MRAFVTSFLRGTLADTLMIVNEYEPACSRKAVLLPRVAPA
jgi:hypothetical protein